MPLSRYTERTICDRQLLATELDRIAANGYAVDNEEYVLGVACVAVPARAPDGEVVAAVAVHAATARLPLARAIEFVPILNDAAAAIARTFA
jgi:DNA-binding IclR family transcriptional regulator